MNTSHDASGQVEPAISVLSDTDENGDVRFEISSIDPTDFPVIEALDGADLAEAALRRGDEGVRLAVGDRWLEMSKQSDQDLQHLIALWSASARGIMAAKLTKDTDDKGRERRTLTIAPTAAPAPKAAEPTTEPEKPGTPTTYEGIALNQLRTLAAERNIKPKPHWRKNDYVAALEAHDLNHASDEGDDADAWVITDHNDGSVSRSHEGPCGWKLDTDAGTFKIAFDTKTGQYGVGESDADLLPGAAETIGTFPTLEQAKDYCNDQLQRLVSA